jgi:hypothetical protein
MAKVGRPMGKLHQADVRAKIQASQLIKALQDHALKGGEFEPTRLRAIEILLKKSLPDLVSVEHTGEGGGPIDHSLTVSFVAKQ